MYDASWYHRVIADKSGEPIHFLGGPLAGIDFELDALYQGVAHENRRRWLDYALRCTLQLPRLLAGDDVTVLGYQELDNTAFIPYLLSIWEPHQLPTHMDPGRAIAFRMDILRALACIYPSEREVFVHFMDGYTVPEVASLMGWKTENVERTLRRAAQKVRVLCDVHVPGRRKVGPPAQSPWALLRPLRSSPHNGLALVPTSAINDAELALQDVRRRRRNRRRAAA